MIAQPELRETLLRLLARDHLRLHCEGHLCDHYALPQERLAGDVDAARFHWIVRGAPGAVEFRFEVSELAPARPLLHFDSADVIEHTAAPPWMTDRPCAVLGGRYCRCVHSHLAGQEMLRWWMNHHDEEPEKLFLPLLELYRATFGPACCLAPSSLTLLPPADR